ncbi:hypothetical protein PYW08_007631 [Mythimna loreyi]|uniref:Uncharacterized protein n=1 Tax=Mythimna loreyi TaxID=667449 RepID=A0ACC2QDC6_9NEOP|nr:hypothetical protein PYW08_007631 [Mythimna loreyi]
MPRVQRSPPPPSTVELKSPALPSTTAELKSARHEKKSPLSNLHSAVSDPKLSTFSTQHERIKDIFVNANRRAKRRLGDNPFYDDGESEDVQLLSAITRLFSEFESKQNQKFDSLKSTMDDIAEQNSRIQTSVEFISGKYDELLDRLAAAERENSTLNRKISSLESKIDYLERCSRSATLEINNLPATDSENKESLLGILCKIGDVVKEEIRPSDVSKIYRLKAKTDSHIFGTVVAEFKSSTIKENIIKASRNFNKQSGNNKLSTASIQLPGPPKPIYIADSLTSYGKHLFYLGRRLQKDGKCHSCWSSHGKIYIKKSAGSTPSCINCESDLQKFGPATL